MIEADNNPHSDFETGLLIAYAYPERIACARPGNNAQFQMANGRFASAGHRDDLAHEPWLAVAHVNDRDRSGKIFMANRLTVIPSINQVTTVQLLEISNTDNASFESIKYE